MAWPKTITTLTADDICILSFRSGKRCCLATWIIESFPNEAYEERCEFEKTIIKNAVAAGSSSCSKSLIAHNDFGGLTKAQLAEVWNQSLRDHDYDA